MSSDITLTIAPMGAVRTTQRSKWNARSQKYEAYKTEIRLRLPGYALPPMLSIGFVIAMPRSWSKKKRSAMDGQPHQSRPDIDNLVKGFMDAFGVEDSHVWHVTAYKVWGEAGQIIVHAS